MNNQELWQDIGRVENAVLENPKDYKLRRELAQLYFKAGTKWQPFNTLMDILMAEFPHDISALYLMWKGQKAQKKRKRSRSIKSQALARKPYYHRGL